MGFQGLGAASGAELMRRMKERKNLPPPLKSIGLLGSICGIIGCGYSARSALPNSIRTIYVEDFKNKINFTDENKRDIYFPLLEVDVRNAVIDRYLFDGDLRIADADTADLILQGELVRYERSPLRYTDNNDVLEYRVQIFVNLNLLDARNDKEPIWVEPDFAGEATYFVSGPQAASEASAVKVAIDDLARRIVDRTVENW